MSLSLYETLDWSDLPGDERALRGELRIVWVQEPGGLDYVREGYASAGTRGQRVPRDRTSGRLIGYAVLAPDVPSEPGLPGMFRRRYFWLAPHDRDSVPDGPYRTGCPLEAVDPRTIVAGVAGELTDRAAGVRRSLRASIITGAELLAEYNAMHSERTPPDPAAWRAFLAADEADRWCIVVEHEPRLRHLLAEAKAVRDPGNTDWFCAHAYWYGYSGQQSLRDRVIAWVGWEVDHRDGLLGSMEAYDVAYEQVHDALPECRGDCPCLTMAYGARPRIIEE